MSSTPPRRPTDKTSKGRVPLRSLATLNARKRLLFAEAESQGGPKQPTCIDTWSDEESKALVEFVLFHAQEGRWPTFPKSSKFWAEVAEYVQKRGGSDSKRTGKWIRAEISSLQDDSLSLSGQVHCHITNTTPPTITQSSRSSDFSNSSTYSMKKQHMHM